MDFSILCDHLSKLEAISSRLKMLEEINIVFGKIKKLKEDQIKKIVYLLQGSVAPGFEGIKFNVSDRTVSKILGQIFSPEEVRNKFRKVGDYGDAFSVLKAEKGFKKAKKSVTTDKIYGDLIEITGITGKGSIAKKEECVKKALSDLDGIQGKYFIRILLERLRTGYSDKTIIEALSVYLKGDKSLRAEIERAYGLHPDMGEIASKLIREKEKALKTINIEPGVPILVKLVQREAELEDILKRMNPALVQPKLDGIRCQIHVCEKGRQKKQSNTLWQPSNMAANNKQEGLFKDEKPQKDSFSRVKLFTRNLEDISSMFPEIVKFFSGLKGIKTAIFDSEIIARNPSTGKFMPFQETMKRKRKYDIQKKMEQLPVEVSIFDVVYLNGKNLSDSTLNKRLDMLDSLSKQLNKGKFHIIETLKITQETELEETFKKYINLGLEGIIAKDGSSIYKVGTRNFDWIKFKRASRSALADTLDVVAMGYYQGRGRQTKFGIGAFLVGIYDSNKDKIVTVAKVGTGVTDKQWEEIYKAFNKIKVNKEPAKYKIAKALSPDHYIEPKIVCVVEADEITKSPIHTSGYALRFPRLKEFNRKDKGVKDTTSVKEFTDIYKLFISGEKKFKD